jgi:phage shock protein C
MKCLAFFSCDMNQRYRMSSLNAHAHRVR